MSLRSGASARASALGLAGLLALTGCPARPKAETRGPFLSVLPREGTTVAHGALPPGAIALALGGLPPEELPRLRERLEESMDAAMRRAAPMLYDLDELAEEDAAAPDPTRCGGRCPTSPR